MKPVTVTLYRSDFAVLSDGDSAFDYILRSGGYEGESGEVQTMGLRVEVRETSLEE